MFEAIVAQLSGSPYLLGQEITAADILWGNALRWGSMFKLLPENAVVAAYVNRVTSRPSFAEAAAIDARLVSERDAAGAAQ
jgi:glutathione S-transferase